MPVTPALRPIADTGVLVEFADHIDDTIHQRVLNLDAAIQEECVTGITELIPAYSSLFVGYDPLLTDYEAISREIATLLDISSDTTRPAGTRFTCTALHRDTHILEAYLMPFTSLANPGP